MPIDASCQCGKRIKVKDELAGKRVKCPACGQAISIPKPDQPEPAALEDEFGLPAMPNLDFDDMAFPAASDPLASAPLQSAPLAKAVPAAGKARGGPSLPGKAQPATGGLPKAMWLAMGGFALLAVIVVVVVLVMGSGDEEVAVAPPAAAPGAGEAVPEAAPPSPAVDASEAASSTTSTDPSGEMTTDPATAAMATTGDAAQELPVPGAVATPTQPAEIAPGASPPVATVAGPRTTAMAALPPAMSKWHATPAAGMRSFPDKMRLLGYSWMVELLPHLEQQELYDKFDFQKSWSEPINLQHGGASIPAFLNPGDPRTHWRGYPFENMGLTHYVGMSGIEDRRNVVAAELPRSDPRAGVFGYDAVARPAEISDGTSQTIMVLGSGNLVGPWVQGGGATIRGARAPYFDAVTGFGSKGLSQQGAQVMFADGSVRAISADIDPKVFRAMCTIRGADSVDLSSVEFFPAEASPAALPAGTSPAAGPPESSSPSTTDGASSP